MFWKGLLFPVEEPEYWAKKYGLQITYSHCSQCHNPCVTSIPFASKTMRGLISPPCEFCGNELTPLVYIDITEKKK